MGGDFLEARDLISGSSPEHLIYMELSGVLLG